jgi:hypothetical protein
MDEPFATWSYENVIGKKNIRLFLKEILLQVNNVNLR